MEFDEFSKTLQCRTQLYLGNEYETGLNEVRKNNGVVLSGLWAKKKGENISPTLYIDDYYSYDMKAEEIDYIGMKLAQAFANIPTPNVDSISDFGNFGSIKENIFFKIVNAEKNRDLLFDIPHRRFHNLVVCYYVMPKGFDDRSGAYITVRNEHIESWDVTEEELYDIAYDNTKIKLGTKFSGICDVLNELCGKDVMSDEMEMYVLSNLSKAYGASCMLFDDKLSEIADELDSNYYILPSSIHELIIMPDNSEINVKSILLTVTEINRTQVETQDVLADSVYYFDRNKGTVEWLC